jgi:hypothetical protein
MKDVQCFLLKSLNEPAGTGVFAGGGVVCDQMYSESPRSMGASVRASINSTRKARKNIRSIPADMNMASRIRGMVIVLLDRMFVVADSAFENIILQF